MSECKGCRGYNIHTKKQMCIFEEYKKIAITSCPCRTCIVKVTCMENCKLLRDHIWEMRSQV